MCTNMCAHSCVLWTVPENNTPFSPVVCSSGNDSLSAEPKEKTSSRSNYSALSGPQFWGQHLPLPPNTTTEVPRGFWVCDTAQPPSSPL